MCGVVCGRTLVERTELEQLMIDFFKPKNKSWLRLIICIILIEAYWGGMCLYMWHHKASYAAGGVMLVALWLLAWFFVWWNKIELVKKQ